MTSSEPSTTGWELRIETFRWRTFCFQAVASRPAFAPCHTYEYKYTYVYIYIIIDIILYDIVLYYINYGIYWSFIGFNQPKQDETNEPLGRLIIATNFVAVWWLSNKSGVRNV